MSVLELLQWKEDVQDAGQLLGPLSQVLRHLLTSTASLPAPAPDSSTKVDAMDTSDEEDSDASSVDTQAPAGAHRWARINICAGRCFKSVHQKAYQCLTRYALHKSFLAAHCACA